MVASKGNVEQTVISVLGVIGAFVATLLTTPLDGSVDTLAGRAIQALPRFAIGVAAGVATIFAARLLTFVGRKVRPWFRTRAAKLRALASEIEELYGFQTPTKTDDLLLMVSYHQRCDELIAKLEKIGVPAPTREQFVILHSFLTVLYDCAIRGDVEKAKGVLKELEPEVDVLHGAADAAKLKALVPEIEELHSRKSEQLLEAYQMDDMSVSHFLHRCDELKDKLSKLGIPSPMPLRGGLSRWRDFLRRLHASAIRGNVKEARGELERLDAYRKSVEARGGLFGERRATGPQAAGGGGEGQPTDDQGSGAERAPADRESGGGAS